MKTQTKTILEIIKYLALIGGIGFSIECGSQIISLIVSFWNPELLKKMYLADRNVEEVRNFNLTYFYYAKSLVIAFAGLKAHIWYYLFDFLDKLKLKNPFTNETATKVQNISYLLLALWVLAAVGDGYFDYISKRTDIDLVNHFNQGEYFFMAGIVYIISQIFQRGVELQEENELTV